MLFTFQTQPKEQSILGKYIVITMFCFKKSFKHKYSLLNTTILTKTFSELIIFLIIKSLSISGQLFINQISNFYKKHDLIIRCYDGQGHYFNLNIFQKMFFLDLLVYSQMFMLKIIRKCHSMRFIHDYKILKKQLLSNGIFYFKLIWFYFLFRNHLNSTTDIAIL